MFYHSAAAEMRVRYFKAPKIPKPPKPEPIEQSQAEKTAEQREAERLRKQRQDLERSRAGRSSLVVDPGVGMPEGGSGLRIP